MACSTPSTVASNGERGTPGISQEQEGFQAKSPYGWIEGTEQPTDYRPGGFHPICVGDLLRNRYYIVNKLGHGGFATVWLARDLYVNVLVAIKILRADSPESSEAEVKVAKDLAGSQSSYHYSDKELDLDGTVGFILPVLDSFTLKGPNGQHSCLVSEAAAGSLSSTKSGEDLLQPDVARVIAAQTVLAISLMHSAGLVHGDVHRGNVLLGLPAEVHQLSDEELYSTFEETYPIEIYRYDGKPLSAGVPSYIYESTNFLRHAPELELVDGRSFLADFGESFSPYLESRAQIRSPYRFRPPEDQFEPARPVSFHTDIWSLGCLLWDLFTLDPPFTMYSSNHEDFIFDQVRLLGPLPQSWWDSWEARHDYFDEGGQPRQIDESIDPLETLESKFEKTSQEPRAQKGWDIVSVEEKSAFLAMVRSMLKFEPEERATIQQVLECEWIQRWAMPELIKLNSGNAVRTRALGKPKLSPAISPSTTLCTSTK